MYNVVNTLAGYLFCPIIWNRAVGAKFFQTFDQNFLFFGGYLHVNTFKKWNCKTVLRVADGNKIAPSARFFTVRRVFLPSGLKLLGGGRPPPSPPSGRLWSLYLPIIDFPCLIIFFAWHNQELIRKIIVTCDRLLGRSPFKYVTELWKKIYFQ